MSTVPHPSSVAAPLRTWRAALPLVDRATSRVSIRSGLLDALVGAIDPTLSLHAIRARVLDVVPETHDTRTFVLQPNARWSGFTPGSFVTLRLRIDGRVVHRSYSLSSAPEAGGTIAITVKRVPGGLVSGWLCDRVKAGDVLEMTAAQGAFVLPDPVPSRLLMLSAGSGITPVMSMLRHLVATRTAADVAFSHFARSPDDVVFRDELRTIAAASPNVHLRVTVEQAGAGWSGGRGRFRAESLDEAAPDWRTRPIYLCGPSPFMAAVIGALERAAYDLGMLRYERFGGDFDVAKLVQAGAVVRFRRSGIEAIARTPRTILEEAEARGLRPEHGCRMGVCGACRCTKRSGVVVNVTTGCPSGAGEESILPCVSVARGAVVVDL